MSAEEIDGFRGGARRPTPKRRLRSRAGHALASIATSVKKHFPKAPEDDVDEESETIVEKKQQEYDANAELIVYDDVQQAPSMKKPMAPVSKQNKKDVSGEDENLKTQRRKKNSKEVMEELRLDKQRRKEEAKLYRKRIKSKQRECRKRRSGQINRIFPLVEANAEWVKIDDEKEKRKKRAEGTAGELIEEVWQFQEEQERQRQIQKSKTNSPNSDMEKANLSADQLDDEMEIVPVNDGDLTIEVIEEMTFEEQVEEIKNKRLEIPNKPVTAAPTEHRPESESENSDSKTNNEAKVEEVVETSEQPQSPFNSSPVDSRQVNEETNGHQSKASVQEIDDEDSVEAKKKSLREKFSFPLVIRPNKAQMKILNSLRAAKLALATRFKGVKERTAKQKEKDEADHAEYCSNPSETRVLNLEGEIPFEYVHDKSQGRLIPDELFDCQKPTAQRSVNKMSVDELLDYDEDVVDEKDPWSEDNGLSVLEDSFDVFF